MEYAVELQNVSMHFNLQREKLENLKEYFIRVIRRQKIDREAFVALNDVSVKVEKGDVFGIVGLNGSGKSTLLKLVSGILKPTIGTVTARGTIAPLIELGAGFDLELTAKENVYLNGAVLGFSKQYIKQHYDEIVDFSEMHDFMDVPLKNFSSGMVARVAFAVATITRPEILIVDEILGVGDFLFKQKCEARIDEMMKGGTTVLLVSHSSRDIERLCKHAMWLEKGNLRMVGDAREVCAQYGKQGVAAETKE